MKKFLLLFALIISGMGLFAQDAAVEITVYEQTATKLTLKFTPNEYTKQYYCGVFEKEGVGFSLDKAGELYYSEPCVGENIYQFEIQYPVNYNACAVAIGYDDNPEDVFFGDLFGGGGSRRRSNNGPMQGANVRASVRITFEEAVFGCKKEIQLNKYVKCETCSGTGASPGTSKKTCTTCGGSGHEPVQAGFVGKGMLDIQAYPRNNRR